VADCRLESYDARPFVQILTESVIQSHGWASPDPLERRSFGGTANGRPRY